MSQGKIQTVQRVFTALGRRVIVILSILLVCVIALYFAISHAPRVAVAIVQRGDIEAEVEGTGTVTADALVNIAPQITGRVEQVFVNEGDKVHAGQLLAQLDQGEQRHQIASAQSQVDAAATSSAERHREWSREQTLVTSGAVGHEEAQQYEERDAVAKSSLVNARAHLALAKYRLSLTVIRALSDGIVTQRWVVPGAAVVPGQAMLTVADTHLVYVNTFIDQSLAGGLRPGQSAIIMLRGYQQQPLDGRILRIRPRADSVTEETVAQVSFEWPATIPFQLGAWANVFIRVGAKHDALLLPKAALMPMGNATFVWTVDAQDRLHSVPLRVIASSPRSPLVAVSGSLRDGDRVVLMPMDLRVGQRVRPSAAASAETAEGAQ